ncbi:hypothetical protein V8E53_002219 [Lactarius tabidus]
MAAGYGVWGVETYLERFWTCLDWAAVRDCVCAVCVSQVGFRVRFLSAYVSLCSSFFRSSEGRNIKIIGFKRIPIVRTTGAVGTSSH